MWFGKPYKPVANVIFTADGIGDYCALCNWLTSILINQHESFLTWLLSSMSKKYTYYFCKMLPENYTFLSFYKYWYQQSDFTFSYQNKSRKLKCDLKELTREDSEAVKVSVNKLI